MHHSGGRRPERFGARPVRPRGQGDLLPAESFLARYTDAMLVGPNRWLYALHQVLWDPVANDWVALPEGHTSTIAGDPFAAPAVNGAEAGNDGSGVELLGVNIDALPGTFEIVPINNEPVLPTWVLPRLPGDAQSVVTIPRYVFAAGNMIDGDCGAASSGLLGAPVTGAGPGLQLLGTGQLGARLGSDVELDERGALTIRRGGTIRVTADGRAEVYRPSVDAYESAGGQTIDGTAATVTLDTTRIDDEASAVPALSYDGSELTVNAAGVIELDLCVGLAIAGGGEARAEAWLERDDGTGWAEVPGSRLALGSTQ